MSNIYEAHQETICAYFKALMNVPVSLRPRQRPVVAFAAKDFVKIALKKDSNRIRVIRVNVNDLNDLLSFTSVCNAIGTLITIVEFERGVYYAIRADQVWSATREYHSDKYRYPDEPGDDDEDEDADE